MVLYLSLGPVPEWGLSKGTSFLAYIRTGENHASPEPLSRAEGGYEVNKYNMKINKTPVQTNHLPQ